MKNGIDLQNFNSILPYKIYISKVTHFNLHWHNFIEIFFVKKGNIRITTGDFSFHLDEGHICFIDSGIIHSINQTDVTNEILVLQISTEISSPFHSLQKYKFNSETYLSDLSNATLPLSELQKLLNNCYEESMFKASGYQNIISSFINALIGIMIRHYYLVLKTDDDYIAESNLQRLSKIINYLNNHYTEKISLQELANDLHMNYYYLSHFFKDTAGVSYHDYLNNLRVDKSLFLLSDPSLTITRIAYDIGFPNIKAYTKAFKEKFGVLPSEYRKTIITTTETSFFHSDNDNTYVDAYTMSAEPFFSSQNTIRDFMSISEEVSLHHDAKHTLFENIDIYTSTANSRLVTPQNKLYIEETTLASQSTADLIQIRNALDINSLCIFAENQSSFIDKNLIKQKSTELDCTFLHISNYKLTSSEFYHGIEAFSLLSGVDIISQYLVNDSCLSELSLFTLKDKNITLPFINSSSLMTSFSVPTPSLYAYSFLQKLSGTILYHSNSCIVIQNDKIFQILCYHSKSLETYRSLNKDNVFQLENYLFFIESFPSIKFTFSFKNLKNRLKQTTFQVSNKHGCILNNWITLGTPDFLTSKLSSYLKSVTQPMLNVKIPPFRETPIITVDLPPLGFSYILLEQI